MAMQASNKDNDAKLAEAFAAIERMQQNFNEVKDGYEKNIKNWEVQIKKYAINLAKEAKENAKNNPNSFVDDKKEYFDEPQELQSKIKKLANLIRKSKHLVVFTGAGISTSCGIADFRSGVDTVLKTGAGKWAKEDAMRDGKWNKKIQEKHQKLEKNKTSTFKAVPSPSHMALIALEKAGHLKHLVSQNTDGLHRRSGFPINHLSELHGNSTLEECPVCYKQYMRDFRCSQSRRNKTCTIPRGYFSRLMYVIDNITADLKADAYSLSDADVEKMTKRLHESNEFYKKQRTRFVANQQKIYDGVARERRSLMFDWERVLNANGHKVPRYMHHTGRMCTVKGCTGQLTDTIINFQEPLPEKTLERAQDETEQADLFLVLGSSCAVYPAADMPEDIGCKWADEMRENKEKEPVHNLCIVNIQKTPLHHLSSLPIHAKIDEVMIGIMKELGLEIPTWSLTRYIKMSVSDAMNGNKGKLCISGCDADGTPFSLFKNVTLRQQKNFIKKKIVRLINNKENNEHDWDFIIDDVEKLSVELKFVGNYDEPNLIIGLNEYLKELVNNGQIVLKLSMNLTTKEWTVENQKEQAIGKNDQNNCDNDEQKEDTI